MARQQDQEAVYVIACGKKKAEGPAPARDFYVGGPTQEVLAVAEAKGRTFILSALHGLVDPDSIIVRPYDLKLDELSDAERLAWLLKVRAQLRARGIAPSSLVYVGQASAYAAAVESLKEEA